MTAPGSLKSAFYWGRVMHQRMNPKKHRFRYRVFSVLFDLDELETLDRELPLFGHNRFSLYSFNDRDHGPCDGSPLRPWLDAHLSAAHIDLEGGRVQILCMPRVLGHTFNPISVWFCYGPDEDLRAVLYEVHNTFGDKHSYLVPINDAQADQRVLHHDAVKKLYVSPFMPVTGGYSFRLEPAGETYSLLIRYEGEEGDRLIATHRAKRTQLTAKALLQALFKAPMIPLKVVFEIHWEALHLFTRKRATFFHRPEPLKDAVSLGSSAQTWQNQANNI
ncbi:MAG: DUF1365 domain-containing protein [Alphaproteobacteria bacterium]|nr:DUF1365 domain-containing protein [Alphaproteobacteria bacterium]